MNRLMCVMLSVILLPATAGAQAPRPVPESVSPPPELASPLPEPVSPPTEPVSPRPRPALVQPPAPFAHAMRLELNHQIEREHRARLDGLNRQLHALGDQHVAMAQTFAFADAQGSVFAVRRDAEHASYASGLNALQQRQYERAVAQFDRVITQAAERADGAMYWKAFAQHKLARIDEALAILAALRRDHPQSRYLADAKVLEADIRRTTGQPVTVEELSAHEDITLLALNGLAHTDPARAIPSLEAVLNAANSLAVKRRAIYVLALNEDVRAHQVLLRYAKGAGNPDLQNEAIRYLATRRDDRTTSADLKAIFEATQDPAVRRAIVEASRGSAPMLVELYAIGQDVNTRRAVIAALASQNQADALVALARKETNLELKTELVRRLSAMAPKSKVAADYLVEVLNR